MLPPLPTTLLVAALSILTASCATTATSGGDAVCAHWRGISWSAQDTPQTIGEVKGSNARRKAWCGK